MDDDPELAALRARRLKEILGERSGEAPAPVPAAAPAPVPPAAPVDVTDVTLPDLVGRHDAVVVDLWAPWCGPCKAMAPAIDALARHFAGRVVFAKLNTDENPLTPGKYQIQSIPTLLVFRRGKLIDRWVGAMPQSTLAMRVKGLIGA